MKDGGLRRVFSGVLIKDWENISENLPKGKYRIVYDVVQLIEEGRREAIGVYDSKTSELSVVANSDLERIVQDYHNKYYALDKLSHEAKTSQD